MVCNSLGMAVVDPFVDVLNDKTPLYPPWGRIAVIVALFALAWAISRLSAIVARQVLAWHDRLHRKPGERLSDRITNIRRRETSVAVIRAGIAYLAFAAALVLSVGQLMGGVDRLTAIAGASFFLILAGFSVQRVLTDLIAGAAMFAERWYSVGDTIVIPTMELQGVVEDVSLRRTKLRTLDGEMIHVHNSQIPAVRVLPRGAKELAIEVFVSDPDAAARAIASVTSLVPEGPTTFVRRPVIDLVEELSQGLVRIRLTAAVAPGREWLAEGFFPDLLREQAADVIVHGPVTLSVDEGASRSFARATASSWVPRAAA
jgi:small-conductance mechanosensitive channel